MPGEAYGGLMKHYSRLPFPGIIFALPIKTMGLSFAVLIFFAGGLAGQLVTPPHDEKVVPASQEKILLGKVMTDLPHYGNVTPAPVAPQPVAEALSEVVTLVPYVVVGAKGVKISDSELLTKKAFAANISKQSGYSAFAMFQYREDVRLQDMATLQNYADSLMLVGDLKGSREIKKESNRLFLRRHDPESEYIDSLFNPRTR